MSHGIVWGGERQVRVVLQEPLILRQSHEEIAPALQQLPEGGSASLGTYPHHIDPEAKFPRDFPGELRFKTRLVRVLTGERQVLRVGAEPEGACRLELRQYFPRALSQGHGEHAHRQDQRRKTSHSASPKPMTMPPKFILRTASASFGSVPHPTALRGRPPATLARYCFPPTEYVMVEPVTPIPTLNSHSCSPVLASSPTTLPSGVPMNTNPPAVVVAPPPTRGNLFHHSQTTLPRATSKALSTPA